MSTTTSAIKRRRDGWPAVSAEAHRRADKIYEQLRALPKSLRSQIIDELHDLGHDEILGRNTAERRA
jgi:hypothetical protein